MQCTQCGGGHIDVINKEVRELKISFVLPPEALAQYERIQDWALEMTGLSVADIYEALEMAGAPALWEHQDTMDIKDESQDYQITCMNCGTELDPERITAQLVQHVNQLAEALS